MQKKYHSTCENLVCLALQCSCDNFEKITLMNDTEFQTA